jgi:CheY-like chemotaxis protein
VVSDDRSLADFLGEGLVMGGFWTSLISHGLQVLEVFRLRQFDLIVVDRDLGSFDALELIERLRGRSDRAADSAPRTTAPIVVVSSGDAGITPEMQQDLDIAAILQAPIELEDAVRTLHEVFAAWRSGHPNAPLADDASAS